MDLRLATLKAGLDWLCNTAQPAGALIQHHGVQAPPVDGRCYGFVPAMSMVRLPLTPVVTVRVADPHWADEPSQWVLTNPLGGDTERRQITAVLDGLGFSVSQHWGNWDGECGSLAIAVTPHPSLADAVNTYHAGCPQHPARGVFCPCGWSRKPSMLLKSPVWPQASVSRNP